MWTGFKGHQVVLVVKSSQGEGFWSFIEKFGIVGITFLLLLFHFLIENRLYLFSFVLELLIQKFTKILAFNFLVFSWFNNS